MKKYLLLILVLSSIKSISQTVISETFNYGFGDWSVERVSGTSVNAGWTVVNSSTNTAYPYNPSNMAMFNSAILPVNEKFALKSPLFSLNPAKTYTLTFKIYRSNTAPTEHDFIRVYLASYLGTVNRFYQDDPVVSGNYFQTITYTITGNSNNQISIEGWSKNGDNIFIDDIELSEAGQCNSPQSFSTSNITSNSVNLNYSTPSPVPTNGYEYYISTSSATPYLAAVATGVLSSSGQNISGLLPETNYYVWARSVCSQYFKSDWTVSNSFRTLCGITSIPYTENFSSTPDFALPSCTTVQAGNGSPVWQTVNNLGYKQLQITRPIDTDLLCWFFTKPLALNAGQTYQLSYLYKNSSTTDFNRYRVSYGPSADDGNMTTTIVPSTYINNTTPATNTVSFIPTNTGSYVIGFLGITARNRTSSSMIIDDISVTTLLSNDSFKKNRITIYPNPVNNLLNVTRIEQKTKFEIYNLLGQLVMSDFVNVNQTEINVQTLNKGVYILKFQSETTFNNINFVKD